MDLDRRSWLATFGVGAMSAAATQASDAKDPGGGQGCPPGKGDLLLKDFHPRSMLHVKETHVKTPRFPVIDVHTHFTFVRGGRQGAAPEDAVAFNATAKDALAVMDRKGVRAVVNVTGGFGRGLEEALASLDRAHPGRFYTCTEPM